MTKANRIIQFNKELKSAPQSGLLGYYFPWNAYLKAYDTSSFDPSYSEGLVSQIDLHFIMRDINAIRGFDPSKSGPRSMWCLSVIPILALGIYFSSGEFFLEDLKSRILLLISTLLLTIALLWTFNAVHSFKERKRTQKCSKLLSKILERHQNSTLYGKQVIARASPNAAFISLEFSFRSKYSESDSCSTSAGSAKGYNSPDYRTYRPSLSTKVASDQYALVD